MNRKVTLFVALGSMLGTLLRYSVDIALTSELSSTLPWSTLSVNIIGSLLIGWIAGIHPPDDHWLNRVHWRQFLVTGLCGGFTTFSLFSVQTMMRIESGAWVAAGLNMGITLVLMMAAVTTGYRLAQSHNQR